MPWKPNMTPDQRRRLNDSRRRQYATKQVALGKKCVHNKDTPPSPNIAMQNTEQPHLTNLTLLTRLLAKMEKVECEESEPNSCGISPMAET